MIGRDIIGDLDANLSHFNSLYHDLFNENKISYYTWSSLMNVPALSSTNSIKLIHTNIRSLLPKCNEFFLNVNDSGIKFDVVCFSETWLKGETVNLLQVDNYVLYRCLREGIGGGVSAFVRSEYCCEVIDSLTLSLDYFESLFLKIKSKNDIFLLAVIYRPPSSSSDMFFDKFGEVLNGVNVREFKDIFITGDFNYDLLNQAANQDSVFS